MNYTRHEFAKAAFSALAISSLPVSALLSESDRAGAAVKLGVGTSPSCACWSVNIFHRENQHRGDQMAIGVCKRNSEILIISLMKFFFAVIAMLVAIPLVAQQTPGSQSGPTYSMVLTSSSFEDGAMMPSKYTQAEPGPTLGGLSPQLAWDNVPANTQSFVLYMHDMEVARNRSTNDNPHWIVWSIPASTKSLAEGLPNVAQLPDGSRQMSSGGPVYRGPGAPAAGPPHHYVFEIYALDINPDIAPAANMPDTRAKIFEAIQGHILAKGIIVGKYRRSK